MVLPTGTRRAREDGTARWHDSSVRTCCSRCVSDLSPCGRARPRSAIAVRQNAQGRASAPPRWAVTPVEAVAVVCGCPPSPRRGRSCRRAAGRCRPRRRVRSAGQLGHDHARLPGSARAHKPPDHLVVLGDQLDDLHVDVREGLTERRDPALGPRTRTSRLLTSAGRTSPPTPSR